MKIAIINNGTVRLAELSQAFPDHQVEIIHYNGQIDEAYLDSFDAVVLSGSSQHGAHSKFYDAEIAYLQKTTKPVLGICLGFELMSLIHDMPIYELPTHIEGAHLITVEEDFTAEFGEKHIVRQKHKWVTQTVSEDFRVMFVSSTGIEGVIHKTRPLLGVQFHPEVVQPEDPNPLTAQQLLDYLLQHQTQLETKQEQLVA